jgi:predicted nucleic acid-binding protein
VSGILVDTSVWARSGQSEVAPRLAEAIAENRVVIIEPIKLELLRSARGAQELEELPREYDALHQIELTAEIQARARQVQALLAKRGWHRGPSPVDLLAAAAAELADAELWHCHRHFKLIAKCTGQSEKKIGRA